MRAGSTRIHSMLLTGPSLLGWQAEHPVIKRRESGAHAVSFSRIKPGGHHALALGPGWDHGHACGLVRC